MTRALVLSGGGPVGIGWESGVVSSLLAAGVEVGEADLVVGTSAGSVVGALLTLGKDPAERFAQDYSDLPASAGNAAAAGMPRFMEAMAGMAEMPLAERLAAIGKMALEADTPSEGDWISRFDYLKNEPWPSGFICTAIDTANGAFRTWDANSGVDLSLAVASSCAVPSVFPPVTIDGKRYYDGGLRTLANAHLAKGHDRVLIATVVRIPREIDEPRANRYRAAFDEDVQVLTDTGSTVEVIAPPLGALGMSFMDPSKAQAAHEYGLQQGRDEAGRVGAFWN